MLTGSRLLLLIIIGSYLPQLQLILARRSNIGITQTYVMFTYLFSASQFVLAMLYSSYGRPITNCIKDQELTGFNAYGALVGPLQFTILWIGSLIL